MERRPFLRKTGVGAAVLASLHWGGQKAMAAGQEATRPGGAARTPPRYAICLKTSQAYVRTLRFEDVLKERAAQAFGHAWSELSPEQVKDFEDFII